MIWGPRSPPLYSVYNTSASTPPVPTPNQTTWAQCYKTNRTVDMLAICFYMIKDEIDSQSASWGKHITIPFLWGKPGYTEFLCHIFRHDLSKQQWSLHSLVSWWQNLVYYNNYVLFIYLRFLFKIKKEKSYALDVGLFFPTKGLQKFL